MDLGGWVGREGRKEGVTTSGSGWAGGEGRKEGVIASGSGWVGSEGRWIQQADLGGWEGVKEEGCDSKWIRVGGWLGSEGRRV